MQRVQHPDMLFKILRVLNMKKKILKVTPEKRQYYKRMAIRLKSDLSSYGNESWKSVE